VMYMYCVSSHNRKQRMSCILAAKLLLLLLLLLLLPHYSSCDDWSNVSSSVERMGGSMETKIESNKKRYKDKGYEDVDKSFGRESRSLKACFELINAGFSDVKHLKGGFSTWKYEKKAVEQ